MSGTAPRKHYNVDRNLMFAEDLTLTATGMIQFAAADVIYRLGPGRMDTVLVISITAIDVSSGNELYDLYLQASDSATLASNVHIIGHLQVGHSSVLLGGATVSSVVGRYEVPFQNVVAGSILLDYARMRLVAAGTTPSITFDAWIANVS
jgi:hypothetical protein